eukprot:EG_transcript_6502
MSCRYPIVWLILMFGLVTVFRRAVLPVMQQQQPTLRLSHRVRRSDYDLESPPAECPAPGPKRWKHRASAQCAGRGTTWAALHNRKVSLLHGCPAEPHWAPCLRPTERHRLSEAILQDECVAVVCRENTTYLTQVLPAPAANTAGSLKGAFPFNVISLLVDSTSVAHFHRDVLAQTQAQIHRLRSHPGFRVFEFCNLRVVGVGSAHNQGAAYRHLTWNATVFDALRAAGYAVGTSLAPSANNREQHLNGPIPVGSHHDLLAGLPPAKGAGWRSADAPKCFGNKYFDDLALEFTLQVARHYHPRAWAAFGYTSLPHSPDLSYTHQLDGPLSAAIAELYDTGLLAKSLLFLWSDHGLSYGSYFRTPAGKQEHRNPFLLLITPKAFADLYPELAAHLRANRNTAITHFDLHATFRHIAHLAGTVPITTPPRRPNAHPKPCLSDPEFSHEAATFDLGRSLMGLIPTHRSCSDMGIRCKFCDLVAHAEVDPQHVGLLTPAVHAFLAATNARLAGAPAAALCSPLTFVRVDRATRVQDSYSVAFVTNSSGGRLALWEMAVEPSGGSFVWREPKRISTYAIDEQHCPALTGVPHMLCLCRAVPADYQDPMGPALRHPLTRTHLQLQT